MAKTQLKANTRTGPDVMSVEKAAAMTPEERTSLLDAQRKGNAWSQEVWNGLNGLNTYNDYRCLMAGWLEIRPEKAMDWAKQPKDNLREAMGPAFAITSSANCDLKQLESAMLKLPASEGTAKVCIEDYFDLAMLSGEDPTAAAIYDSIRLELRPAAAEQWTKNPPADATWLVRLRRASP